MCWGWWRYIDIDPMIFPLPFTNLFLFLKDFNQKQTKMSGINLFLQGNSNISGSAHLGGAAVAAIAWARIKRGRFWLLNKYTNFWSNLWLTNSHSFLNLLCRGLHFRLIVISDKINHIFSLLMLQYWLKAWSLTLIISFCLPVCKKKNRWEDNVGSSLR